MPLPVIVLLSVLTLCYFQLAASAFGGFDNSRLQRLAQASSLSYLTIDGMKSSPYLDTCKLEPIIQVVDAKSESGATIFQSFNDSKGEKRSLVVACRGSATPQNFSTNLKFKLVPATELSLNFVPENAMVHEGFQKASAGLWRELSQPLRDHLISSTSEIIFTGHSLGAATALLCATQFNVSFKEECPSPSIVTFGGPKLCNSVLARHLRNNVLEGCNILHLVHSKDPVLANNKKLWDSLGFESAGIEMECDPYSPLVWDENALKSSVPMFPAWNIVDHCKYMVRIFYLLIFTRHHKLYLTYYCYSSTNTSSRGYMLVPGYFFRDDYWYTTAIMRKEIASLTVSFHLRSPFRAP